MLHKSEAKETTTTTAEKKILYSKDKFELKKKKSEILASEITQVISEQSKAILQWCVRCSCENNKTAELFSGCS